MGKSFQVNRAFKVNGVVGTKPKETEGSTNQSSKLSAVRGPDGTVRAFYIAKQTQPEAPAPQSALSRALGRKVFTQAPEQAPEQPQANTSTGVSSGNTDVVDTGEPAKKRAGVRTRLGI